MPADHEAEVRALQTAICKGQRIQQGDHGHLSAADEETLARHLHAKGYRHVPEGSRVVSEGQGVWGGDVVDIRVHDQADDPSTYFASLHPVEPQP